MPSFISYTHLQKVSSLLMIVAAKACPKLKQPDSEEDQDIKLLSFTDCYC